MECIVSRFYSNLFTGISTSWLDISNFSKRVLSFRLLSGPIDLQIPLKLPLLVSTGNMGLWSALFPLASTAVRLTVFIYDSSYEHFLTANTLFWFIKLVIYSYPYLSTSEMPLPCISINFQHVLTICSHFLIYSCNSYDMWHSLSLLELF